MFYTFAGSINKTQYNYGIGKKLFEDEEHL